MGKNCYVPPPLFLTLDSTTFSLLELKEKKYPDKVFWTNNNVYILDDQDDGEVLDLSSKQLKTLKNIEVDFEKVKILILDNNELNKLEHLQDFSKLTKVTNEIHCTSQSRQLVRNFRLVRFGD